MRVLCFQNTVTGSDLLFLAMFVEEVREWIAKGREGENERARDRLRQEKKGQSRREREGDGNLLFYEFAGRLH